MLRTQGGWYDTKRTSSYSPTFFTPNNCRPSHRIPADIPLPQEVTIDFCPFNTDSACLGPRASFKTFCISLSDRKTVNVPPGAWRVSKNVLKGSESEFGMWPEDSPGRGSESVPRYLCNQRTEGSQSARWSSVYEDMKSHQHSYLPLGRASTTTSASEESLDEFSTTCS